MIVDCSCLMSWFSLRDVCVADQIREMQAMTKQRRLGLMQVLSEDFCNTCLPYPQQVVTAVCDKLPVIALKRNEDLLTIIKVRQRSRSEGVKSLLLEASRYMYMSLESEGEGIEI